MLGELNNGRLDPVTGELLAAGSGLESGLAVVLLGQALDAASDEAVALGADTVYQVQHPLMDDRGADAWVAALEQVCRQTKPSVLLVGKTLIGRDVGPRVAHRLGVGVAQDCVRVKPVGETDRIAAARPVYGGNAMATVELVGEPQVLVMRPGSYDPPRADSTRTGDVIPLEVDLDPSVVKVKHVKTVRRKAEGISLEDAPVVVSGGRGLGGPEPFEQLQELASILGGAVGASRAVCDAGWVDHNLQVGLTGATITPDLYITFGISGASQHMAGCSGAKHIAAVNKDSNANIFKEATFGVVGDWKNVLPSFIAAVRELRGS